jgi:hypothetical protein
MESKATTVRFSDVMYRRLEHAGALTGLPMNSIVVIACLEWLDAHNPPGGPLMSAAAMASAIPWLPPMQPLAKGFNPLKRQRGFVPFDRFTEPAKHVLVTAQQEAERSRKSYIGDEHLLVALLLEEDSLAQAALGAAGVTLEAVRPGLGSEEARKRVGPLELASMKRIIERAFDEAKREGDQYVGTSHLLAALVSEKDAAALAILKGLGITSEKILAQVQQLKQKSSGQD